MVTNLHIYRKEDHQLLDFIETKIIKIEQEKYPEQDIITLPMTTNINFSFNKHPMYWEIMHRHLLYHS